MRDKWTGRLIGKMHNNEISQGQLAAQIGVTEEYVSMVLNGKRKPSGARERFEEAVDTIIKEKDSKEK